MSRYNDLVEQLLDATPGGRPNGAPELHWTTRWLLDKIAELQERAEAQQNELNTLRYFARGEIP